MHSYTSATLAIRAKCSLSYYYHSLPNDQPHCYHRPCCHFTSSVFFPVKPRIISRYLPGQFFMVPSRTALYGRQRIIRVYSRILDSEAMELLDEPEERFHGDELGWKSRRKVEIKSVEGERRGRKDGKPGSCSSRNDATSSVVPSSTLLRDLDPNGTGRRRAGGESMAGYGNNKKGTKFDAVNVAEEEVQEVHKYVDNSLRGRRYTSEKDVMDSKIDDSTKKNDGIRRLGAKNEHDNVDRWTNLSQQVNSRENGSHRSQRAAKISEVMLDDVKRTSVSANMNKTEKSASASRQSSDMDHRLVRHDELRLGQEKQFKVADLHDTNVQNVAYSQRALQGTTIREREEQTKLEQNSAQVVRDKRIHFDQRALQRPIESKYEERVEKRAIGGNSIHLRTDEGKQIDRRVLGHDEARKSTKMLSNVSKVHGSNLEAFSLFEGRRITGAESESNLVQSSAHSAKHKGIQVEINEADRIEMSSINANDILNLSSSLSPQDNNVDLQEYNALSDLNQLSSLREQYSQAKGQAYLQYSAGVESERDTNEFDVTRSNNRRISSLEENYNSRIEPRTETTSAKTSVVLTREEEMQRNTLTGESSKSASMRMTSTGSFDGFSSSQPTYIEQTDHAGRCDIYQVKPHTNVSATKLDKSSDSHVTEFVGKVQKEIVELDESGKTPNVSFEIQIGELSTRDMQATSTMQVGELNESSRYGDGRYIKDGGSMSSSELGLKGPSDEIWDVQGLSSQGTSNAEEPKVDFPISGAIDLSTSTPPRGTVISRRPPKSLWSYVADIIRLSWVLRGHSHSSTLNSDKRTSSNESLSSETWFSGHEPDEVAIGDDTQDDEKISLLKEYVPVKESVQRLSEELKNEDMFAVIEPQSSFSSGLMKKGLSAKGSSSSGEAEHTKDAKSSHGALSSVAIVEQQLASEADSALPSTANIVDSRIRDKAKVLKHSSSYPVAVMKVGFSSTITQTTDLEQSEYAKEWAGNDSGLETFVQPSVITVDPALPRIAEIEDVDMSGNSIPKLESVPSRENLPDIGIKESEIKHRKFQRNKQVLRETFDEWEGAFKLENEQRRLDEVFMKEAILEARKGADTWEVPVGAVLVQNGKIIARGCNMVEELRDSTAHAEMICIREASNLLRTWRLAETTLYVTLEPCPMCAGAILQARIDAVVWGAPNKLLGADGSWVRLFPDGNGDSSADPSSQMVGPIHPFHPKIRIRRGVLATECSDVMQQFFKLRRKKDKRPESPPPPSCLPISNRPAKFFTKLHNIFCMMFCL